MKIGMITDSLPATDFDTLLATAARLELDMLEFGCGNWSSAPHLDLDRMLGSETERRDFKSPLAPGHPDIITTRSTPIRLANCRLAYRITSRCNSTAS